MATADNTTNLKRDNTTDGVNASIETLPASTPSTLGYDESTFVENKWGYRIANSSINPSLITTNYFPFASGSTILENTTSTNEDKATLSFASKINYNLPAGSYATELIMNATANPIVYDINYYNGYDTTSTGIVATQTSTTSSASSIILNPTYASGTLPTRDTYSFAGWCVDNTNRTNVAVNTTTEAVFNGTNTKVTAYNNPATVCNGTIYQTGDYLPLTPNDTNNINFYAVWTPTTFDQAYAANNKTKTDGYYVMQDMTANICAMATDNQYTKLLDNRVPANDTTGSSRTYTIGKLEDGRCWMADNLNLDVYTYKSIISADNTHITGTVGITALAKFNGTDTSYSTSDRYATSAINNNSTYATGGNWINSNSYSDPLMNRSGRCDPNKNSSSNYPCFAPYQGTTSSSTDGSYTYNTIIDLYGLPTGGGTTGPGTASIVYDIGLGAYKIGGYYNYCAVSIGSYCYGNGSSAGTQSGDATEADICPSNWRLPTGSYDGEVRNLANILTNNYPDSWQTSTSPYSFQTMLSMPVSGHYLNGTGRRLGSIGNFFTSTRNASGSSAYMHDLAVSGEVVYSVDSGPRNFGEVVRCIAQN